MKFSRVIFLISFLVVLVTFWPGLLDAQCAMCKAVLENEQIASGNRKSEGINGGIIFLMGIPYLLIGLSLLYFFKFRPKNKA